MYEVCAVKPVTAEREEPRTSPVGQCPLCQDTQSVLFFSKSDQLHCTPGEFAYRRCVACHTVFQDPQVIIEDLELCYPGNYFTHHGQPRQAISPARSAGRSSGLREGIRRSIAAATQGQPLKGPLGWVGVILAGSRFLRERAFYDSVPDEMIPFSPGPLRALEIGCGTGDLLAGLDKAGWIAEGVEWDSRAAQVARERSGVPVWEGDFNRIELPVAAYDLVVLCHVLEHLPEPARALRRIKELLAPDGRAVLIYPNPESLGGRIFRSTWLHWDVPRHLVLPPGHALAGVAEHIGLVPVSVSTRAKYACATFACSRALREGRPVDIGGEFDVSVVDRLQGWLEHVLVGFQFFVGEEVVLVLKNSTTTR